MTDQTTPTVLSIAGSDSGGGAGIQADIKTLSAHGVFATTAITLVTAQNTRGVMRVDALSPEAVSAQIAAVLADLPPDAVKIGALGTAQIVAAVAEALAACPAPLVLDPVMIAKSGDPLLDDGAVAALRARLLPMAALVTPNLPEAARLTGSAPAATVSDAAAQGAEILALGARAVLVKGGHGAGAESADLLCRPGREPLAITFPRIATRNTHGTGCTLSAAIAARLALGHDTETAVRGARGWLQGAIAGADDLGLGAGHGPLDHLHALRPIDV